MGARELKDLRERQTIDEGERTGGQRGLHPGQAIDRQAGSIKKKKGKGVSSERLAEPLKAYTILPHTGTSNTACRNDF